MRKAVIVGAARTAIGTLGGALAQVPAPELGAIAIREALRRAGNLPGDQVNEVILGNVLPAGLGRLGLDEMRSKLCKLVHEMIGSVHERLILDDSCRRLENP